jgi:hypothetical protein
VRNAISDAVETALRIDPEADVSTVALDFPCTFFMLSTGDSLPVVMPAARQLFFSSYISALADRVVEGMRAATGAM